MVTLIIVSIVYILLVEIFYKINKSNNFRLFHLVIICLWIYYFNLTQLTLFTKYIWLFYMFSVTMHIET